MGECRTVFVGNTTRLLGLEFYVSVDGREVAKLEGRRVLVRKSFGDLLARVGLYNTLP